MRAASIGIVAAMAVAVAGFVPGARAQPAKDPDWPCIQVLVPRLSAGQLWGGPPIEEADPQWLKDPRVASLQQRAVGRAPQQEVDGAVQALALEAGADKERALTALFARVFEAMDDRRARMIEAAKRFGRQQRDLQAEIAATLQALEAVPKDSPEAARLGNRLNLLRRILDDRRRSTTAVCEQPIEVERRLGEVARIITAYLE